MMKKIIFICNKIRHLKIGKMVLVWLIASIIIPVNYASTESAWQKDKQEIISKCVQASQLSKSKAAGEIIYYDDEVGFAALVLHGIYPQKHMNKRPGTELCLFDRKKHVAHVSVADDLH